MAASEPDCLSKSEWQISVNKEVLNRNVIIMLKDILQKSLKETKKEEKEKEKERKIIIITGI